MCIRDSGIAYKLVLEVGLIGIQDIKFTTSILPVSYTHLDVYKRQELIRQLKEQN